MVDEHQSLRSRSTHSTPRPPNIPLYGCQSLWLGSSSGTDESVLSWSLVGRQITTPYQHVGNNGHSFRLDKSLQIYSPFLCHDFYRQHNSGLIYQQSRRNTFSQHVWKYGSMENPPVRISKDSTYPRQIQCFGRQVIKNRQSNQNRVRNGSIDSEFNLPNVQLSQFGSVCDMFQSQTSTLCFPSSGQSSLHDRHILHELEQSSCLCISSNNTDSSCPEQDTSISVQNSSYSPSLVATSMVLQQLISAPVRLPLCPKLLTQAKGKFQHQNLQALNLHAWELSSNQLEIENFRKTLQILSLNQDEHQLRKSMMRNGPHIPVGVIERRLIRSRPLLLF